MIESPNYRMVALKLHGLHPRDRKWMLEHFEPAQQKILRALLKELQSLGLVPTDQISNNFAPYPVGALSLDDHIIAEINRADPEIVRIALKDLPDRLKAMILHATQWQWASAVWLSLQQQERERLLRHFDHCGAIKPQVFTALLEAFADEMSVANPIDRSSELMAPARRQTIMEA